MDFYPTAPDRVVGSHCRICDGEIEPTDRGVVADFDYAADTGPSTIVEHVWCHRAVQEAKRQAFLEGARLALHNGASVVADGLNVRAFQIEVRLRVLPT